MSTTRAGSRRPRSTPPSNTSALLGTGLAALILLAGCGGSDSPSSESTSIRKQIADLTLADLERYPVWEYAIDEVGEPGQDEETVKPRPDLGQVDPADGNFVVRARFVARDGTEYHGLLAPHKSLYGGLSGHQPAIVTPQGHVRFWFGIVPPKSRAMREAYRRLGKTSATLFPLRYESALDAGEPISGEILAFEYLSDDAETVLRTKG
jgi:hypothetical protein